MKQVGKLGLELYIATAAMDLLRIRAKQATEQLEKLKAVLILAKRRRK